MAQGILIKNECSLIREDKIQTDSMLPSMEGVWICTQTFLFLQWAKLPLNCSNPELLKNVVLLLVFFYGYLVDQHVENTSLGTQLLVNRKNTI